MRTFERNCELRSKIDTSHSELARAQAIAAKNPAAPPPTITICSRPTDYSFTEVDESMSSNCAASAIRQANRQKNPRDGDEISRCPWSCCAWLALICLYYRRCAVSHTSLSAL